MQTRCVVDFPLVRCVRFDSTRLYGWDCVHHTRIGWVNAARYTPTVTHTGYAHTPRTHYGCARYRTVTVARFTTRMVATTLRSSRFTQRAPWTPAFHAFGWLLPVDYLPHSCYPTRYGYGCPHVPTGYRICGLQVTFTHPARCDPDVGTLRFCARFTHGCGYGYAPVATLRTQLFVLLIAVTFCAHQLIVTQLNAFVQLILRLIGFVVCVDFTFVVTAAIAHCTRCYVYVYTFCFVAVDLFTHIR